MFYLLFFVSGKKMKIMSQQDLREKKMRKSCVGNSWMVGNGWSSVVKYKEKEKLGKNVSTAVFG